MPTLQRFHNCKIAIYAGDHLPPHFHIEGRGEDALVEIATLRILEGNVRKFSAAMTWAADNQDKLKTEWERLNRRAS